MPRRAGLYLRISKDRDGTGLAVQRQREDGHHLITARRWEFVDEYVDNDLSAAGRKKRPEFRRLLDDVVEGRLDAIVTERWDRVSRNRRDDVRIIETCQPRGTMLALMKGADIDFTTASGRLFADMLAGFARHEIELKSERQVRQAQQAAEMGLPGAVGRRAFGFAANGIDHDVVEANILRHLYDRFLTGESMGSLARWLNERGLTTPQGNVWKPQTIREVLANPRNAGLRGMRDVVNPKTGTRSQWHRIIGPAVWQEVVSEETWRATMERIRDPQRPGNHVGRNGVRYLLPGLAICGICGKTLITGGRASERLLRCPTKAHISRRADYIEAYVEEALLAYLARRDTPGVVEAVGEVDLEAIRSESFELRAKLEGLARDYADGILDRAQTKVTGDRIRARLAELDRQIVTLGQVDVVAPLRAATDPGEVWEGYPVPVRREVVRRTMTVRVLSGRAGRPGGLRFDPATVAIEWHE